MLDYFKVRRWFSRKAMDIAREFIVEESMEITLEICSAIEWGRAEAPFKLPLPRIARIYLDKAIRDHAFRATTPNILSYLAKRRHSGYVVLLRLRRRSY